MRNFTYSMLGLGIFCLLALIIGGTEFTPGVIVGWIGGTVVTKVNE